MDRSRSALWSPLRGSSIARNILATNNGVIRQAGLKFRGERNVRWGADKFSKMQEDRAAQKAKRGEMAARLKARAEAEAAAAKAATEPPGRFESIDVGAPLAVAQSLQFRPPDPHGSAPVREKGCKTRS